MSAICARPSKGKGRKSEGGNRRCLPSCAPARRQRRFRSLLKRILYYAVLQSVFNSIMAYPLQIFIIGLFCSFVFHGRVGARTHISAEKEWTISEGSAG